MGSVGKEESAATDYWNDLRGDLERVGKVKGEEYVWKNLKCNR